MLSKRVQILVDEEEYKRLKKLSKKSHKSLGEIFREAAQLYSERLLSRIERLSLVEKMAKLRAPVSEWSKMEKGLLQTHLR